MKSAARLSDQQARNLHLAAQGLLARPRGHARKSDVLAAIERMRALQIDTIHVVARSPYLVLFARIGEYPQAWLDALLEDGAILECWAHEACFVPCADLALHRAHALQRDGHWAMKHALRARREDAEGMQALLAHIRAHGAVKTSDFGRSAGGVRNGWWGWKNEKRWLEALFALGELMIARRENFHRVYDLSERVLANARSRAGRALEPAVISADAMRRAFLLGAVRALGVTQARWINDYFRVGRKFRDSDLDAFVAAGDLVRIEVERWENPGYVHRDHLDALAAAQRGRLRATHTTLLSPFDPVVWDRERAAVLFGFDYRIECYTPAPKRRYGYYVLPILHRGRLVGRLDAKAHRADRVFEVKALFLEDGIKTTPELATALAEAIRRCAEWHATPRVTVVRCKPVGFARALRAALRGDHDRSEPVPVSVSAPPTARSRRTG